MVVAYLLPHIYQGHGTLPQKRQCRHHAQRRTETLELAAVPRVLVVVRREGQAYGRRGVLRTVGIERIAQIPHAARTLGHVTHHVVYLPRI